MNSRVYLEPLVLTNIYDVVGQVNKGKEDYKSVVAFINEVIDNGLNNYDSCSIITHAYYKMGKIKTSNRWLKKRNEY